MARVDKNSLLAGIRGKIGNLVVRVRNGQPYVSRAPVSRKDRAITKAQYIAREQFKQRFGKAMPDISHPPEILSIEAKRNKKGVRKRITIKAIDNVKVNKVKVIIENNAGDIIEQGYAADNEDGLKWTYTTTRHNEIITSAKIIAIAVDIAGNIYSKEMVL